MEISYRRQHNESFMIIELDEYQASYEEKMIKSNDINALLKFSKISKNGIDQYWYDISKKQSLEDYVETNGLTAELLSKIILYLHLALEETDRFLIDSRHIYLSSETVFIEKVKDSTRIYLTYAPEDFSDINTQFGAILEKLLTKTSCCDKDVTELICTLYDISQSRDYTLLELVELIEEKCPSTKEPYVETITLEEREEIKDEKDDYIADYYNEEEPDSESIFTKIFSAIKDFAKGRKEDRKSNTESEDFVVDPNTDYREKTVLLTETQNALGKLVYDGSGHEDDFIISSDNFRIGSAIQNDAVIHARTVSSAHAKIKRNKGDYFITDMNSSNGTWVNGRVVNYKEEVKLKAMDQIRFADVNYVFM